MGLLRAEEKEEQEVNVAWQNEVIGWSMEIYCSFIESATTYGVES